MPDFFFARQPILDGSKGVFGYELLFRNNYENAYSGANGNLATLEILSNALFYTSFQQMVGGKRGLVNFTRDLLLDDVILLFPPEHIIVEVLEDVVPDEQTADACRRIKGLGYQIALDDFTADNLSNPLLPMADYVKVDFLLAKGNDRKLIADALLPLNIVLLAEKVETEEDYREGLGLGYKLFQGYFFSKPIIRSGQTLATTQISSMRMLQAVFKDQCNYNELNDIIRSDVSLSYRMLKLANSPFFGFRTEITSILHAITLLGFSGMKRFVSLMAISATAGSKPQALILTSLTRARMSEEMAALLGCANEAAAFFLTGLFSVLDAMLDCSMKDAISELPVAQEIKSALLGGGNILRNALDAIIAYERGDWDKFSRAAAVIGLREDAFPAIYSSAIAWAADIFQTM